MYLPDVTAPRAAMDTLSVCDTSPITAELKRLNTVYPVFNLDVVTGSIYKLNECITSSYLGNCIFVMVFLFSHCVVFNIFHHISTMVRESFNMGDLQLNTVPGRLLFRQTQSTGAAAATALPTCCSCYAVYVDTVLFCSADIPLQTRGSRGLLR